jgi:hypothetical protein
MKKIIYVIVLLTVSCSSVDPIEPSYHVSAHTIKMDFQDHVYKYQDIWSSWNTPFIDCNPDIQPVFSYQNSNLIIRYCNSIGEIIPSSVVLNNVNCDADLGEGNINVGTTITTLEFMIEEEFSSCAAEKNDLLLLNFNVKNKN